MAGWVPTMRLLSALFLLTIASPAAARDALGVFQSWGAFRDPAPRRCFAIAEPERAWRGGDWRPFASVGHWPARRVRGQIHLRMTRETLAGAPVTLTIGERRFALVARGAEAWAPKTRVDAAIVAAMRSGSSMSVESVARTGRPFADTYRLRGAATAIDAAAIGCLR